MENRYYRRSKNLQSKHETQLNEAFEQIQQTIIEFNTQQIKRNGIDNQQRRSTKISEFRSQRSKTQNNDTQHNETRHYLFINN